MSYLTYGLHNNEKYTYKKQCLISNIQLQQAKKIELDKCMV